LLRHYDKLETNETVCAFGDCEMPSDKGLETLEKINELMAYYSAGKDIFAAWMSDPPPGDAEEIDAIKDMYHLSAVNYQKYKNIGTDLNFRALEWVATIDDFHIDFYQTKAGGTPIKFLVSVPAFNFDLIEDAPGDEDDGPDDPLNEVILDAGKYDGQIIRLRASLWVFNHYQVYFEKVNGPTEGKVYYKDYPDKRFQLSYVRDGLDEFQSNMDNFLNENGFRVPFEIAFGKELVDKIKIKFDNSKPKKKYIVKSVSVKTAGCRGWTKIRKKKPSWLNPALRGGSSTLQSTVMGYIANLDDIDRRLTARETPDWLEFLKEYTYPEISVNYGKGEEEPQPTALGCIVDDLDIGGMVDYIGEELLSLGDAIAANFNAKMCKTEIGIGDPATEEKNKKDKADEEEALKIYESLVKDKMKALEKDLEFRMQSEGYNEQQRENLSEKWELKEGEDPTPDQQRLLNEAMKLATGQRSEYDYPFWDIAKHNAFKKFKYEDSLIDMLFGIMKKNSKGTRPTRKKMEEAFAKMGACGLVKLFEKVIKCLLSGMTLEAALQKMILAALKSMTNDNLGRLLIGLPVDKQAEVLAKVEKQFKSMPSPFDDDNFKTGGVAYVINYPDGTSKVFLKEEWEKEQEKVRAWKKADRDAMTMEDYGERAMAFITGEPLTFQDSVDDVVATGGELEVIREQGSIGKAVGAIQGILIDAYIEAIMETNSMESLLNELDKFPGAKLLAKIISDLACPVPPLFDPPISSFLSTLSLNICDPTLGLTMPQWQGLPPWPGWDVILEALKNALLEELRDMWLSIMWNLLYKLLVTLESILCKSLAALGSVAADALNPWAQEGEEVSLLSAFRDAFCGPDKSDEEVQQTAVGALEAFGALPASTTAGNDMANTAILTLSNNMSKNEILGMLVSNPVDQDFATLNRASNAVALAVPEMAGTLGSPEQLSDLFTQLGSFLSPTERSQIQAALIANLPDAPVSESICLTNDEFEQRNRDQVNQLTNAGLNQQEAEAYVQRLNGAAEDTLAEVVDNLLKFDGPFNIPPGTKQIYNQTDPNAGTSQSDSDLTTVPGSGGADNSCQSNPVADLMNPRRNEETARIFDSLSEKMFDELVVCYVKDLVGGDFNNGGFLNYLMSDMNGNKYTMHNWLTKNFFSKWFYSDSAEVARAEGKEGTISGIFAGFQQGFYPKTIGKALRDNLMEGEVEFATTTDIIRKKKFNAKYDPGTFDKEWKITNRRKARKKADVTLEYSTGGEFPHPIDPEEDPIKTGSKIIGSFSNGIVSKDGGIKENFNYQIQFSRVFNYDDIKQKTVLNNFIVERHLDEDEAPLVGSFPGTFLGVTTYPAFIFREFLNSKWNGIQGYKKVKGNDMYDKINSKMLEMARDYTMTKPGADPANASDADISSGFLFGYEFDDLDSDPDYFTYVGPKGGDYEFEEEEAILGKMKKKHSRVHILNPAVYGGKYSNPPFYIDDPERIGWLGLISSLVPSGNSCDKDADLLDIGSITERVNSQSRMIPYDDRLNIERVCATEIPFDKIASPSTHASIEGTIKATIRINLIEKFLLGMPAYANLSPTPGNYDDGMFELIAVSMKEELMAQNGFGWFSRIKGLNYWLLFLEQCVQVYQRMIDNGEVETDINIDIMLANIRAAQTVYKWPQKNATTYIENHRKFRLPSRQLTWRDINGKEFYSYSLAYQAFDENIFKTNREIKQEGSWVDIILLHQLRFASKILTIRVLEKECTEILKQLIKKEAEYMFDKFSNSMKPKPPISNIQKYFMGLDSMFIGSSLRIGTTEYLIDKQTEGSQADPGDIPHVISNPKTDSPLDNGNPDPDLLNETGVFIIEKYLRVNDKEDAPSFIQNRDNNLKGVVSLKDFQKFVDEHQITLKVSNFKISDCFGSLDIREDEKTEEMKLTGEAGLKYGIRICYAPPEGFKGANVSDKFAMQNKAYNVRQNGSAHTKYIFPITSSEVDLLDSPLADFDWENGVDDPYDLECMVTKLMTEPDFKLFFDKLVPIRTYTSFMAMFISTAFLDAFGDADDERATGEKSDKPERDDWDRYLFASSKAVCRRMFANLYTLNDFDPDEEQDDFGISDWIKNINPFANVLPGILTWWQRRNVRPKPTECQNPFMDLFGG